MNRCVVGVIGHVDHGKTALVKALTGSDTDRLAEEKRRGISIELGFAHLGDGAGRVADLIDMPGHERFVRTMIAGATGIDAVLLVVAANEGVKPQTVEHAEIAGLLGIRRAVVAVTKCDLVTPAAAEAIAERACDLLDRCEIARGRRPLFTSCKTGSGVAEVGAALLDFAAPIEREEEGGLTYFPIDRGFARPGHGPVVTGTLRGGTIAPGDRLELFPARRRVRVRAVQVHGEPVAAAFPGQRAALNLRGVELGELGRGMALAAEDVFEPSEWLTLELRALAGAAPLKNGARLRALFGTSERQARLRLLDRDVLEPGESCFVQLRLAKPAALPMGEYLVLRRNSPAATLAGGRVIEPLARRAKRGYAPVRERLLALRDSAPEARVALVLAEGTASVAKLAQASGLSPVRIAELLRDLPVTVLRSGEVRPREERRKVLAPRRDPGLEADIARQLLEAGLTPPLPKELVIDAASHRAVERLMREGVLIRCIDRDKAKELIFHRAAIAQACLTLEPLLCDGNGLTVSEIASALGVSRKFCMPLLDHLDTVRFTRRVGVRRVTG